MWCWAISQAGGSTSSSTAQPRGSPAATSGTTAEAGEALATIAGRRPRRRGPIGACSAHTVTRKTATGTAMAEATVTSEASMWCVTASAVTSRPAPSAASDANTT